MKRSVFISSTYEDLAEYRRAVWALLEEYQVRVMGMEQFGARKEAPLETCLVEVEQSDIYLGIIGFQYGSIVEEFGKSFTQLEYERALELGKDILIYMMDEEAARVPFKYVDTDHSAERLKTFKSALNERHTVETFTSDQDLVKKLRRDFERLLVSRNSKAPHPEDEFEVAHSDLKRLLIVPKLVSGKDLRLWVRIVGNVFPASKRLCTAFNFEYGNTVGRTIEIVKPNDRSFGVFKELYATRRDVETLLQAPTKALLDIYARPLFTPEDVPRIHAQFYDYGYPVYNPPEQTNGGMGMSWVHLPAEGKIILGFTKWVANLEDTPEINDSAPTAEDSSQVDG